MDREPSPLFDFFASELRRARNAARLSQDALGARIGFSGEMVSKVETGDRRPSDKFAEGCDAAFPEADGLFARLVAKAEKSGGVYPAWFASWVDAEQRAAVIRWWEPLLMPGLLQTADYARAVFDAWRAIDGGADTDVPVAARLARQTIFDRPSPPSVQAVIDETVLHRSVGGAKVMYDQLQHLAEMSERPRVTVQVLPAEVGVHVGLLGAFAIAGFEDDTPGIVYLESPDAGETTRHTATLAKIQLTFDTLRADAISGRASRDLIREVAEERWKA
jgi:transcriptional regulator with XRE-family HTH domain